MKNLSISFLGLITFDLIVTEDEYQAYKSKLKSMVAEKFAKNGKMVVQIKDV